MAAWATIEDVADVTGVAVADATLRAAASVIETFAGRSQDADVKRASDRRNLRLAVCWQAAYMHSNDDVLERVDVRSEYLGEGDMQTANRDDAAAIVLAPLARAALKRLSWLRPRARRIMSPRERLLLDADVDDRLDWRPL